MGTVTEVLQARLDALDTLRAVRFRKRTAKIEPFDAFYQAYVTALIVGIAVLVLSGAVGGDQLTPSQIGRLLDDLPVGLGILAALAGGLGLRSGSRGGPVALEAPDVRHVLLAPVDIGHAMRRPILRQARFGLFVSVVVGGVAGQLLARRTEGNALAWTLSGSLWAMVVAVFALGCAWIACGRRMSRPAASGLAVVLLAWPVAEALGYAPTSPFSMLGRIPVWMAGTASYNLLALVPIPFVLAVAVVGVRTIGGVSIEEMARRSALVGQMRFAATMRDLRTVLVLRRQLLQERPRSSPWLPHRRRRGARGGLVARGWWSLLRTPGTRLLRMVLLAGVAGIAARAAWNGALPLIVVSGLCAFLIGLDAVEPLAQELDHETILELVPVGIGSIHATLLVVPTLTAVAVSIVGIGGAALGGLDAHGLAVAATVAFTTALTGVAGAAVSTVRGAPDPNDMSMLMLPPEAASSRVVYEAALPPVVACLGLVPFLLAQNAADHGNDPTAVLQPGIFIGGLVFALTVAWVRARPAFKEQMAEAFNASEARKRAKRLAAERDDDED